MGIFGVFCLNCVQIPIQNAYQKAKDKAKASHKYIHSYLVYILFIFYCEQRCLISHRYANKESFKRAIQDFENALAANPKHNNARNYLVETLLSFGKR